MDKIERAIAVISNPSHWNGEAWNQGAIQAAKEIALAALCEQAERSKGCEYCNSRFGIATHHINGQLLQAGTKKIAIYCPMCGRFDCLVEPDDYCSYGERGK